MMDSVESASYRREKSGQAEDMVDGSPEGFVVSKHYRQPSSKVDDGSQLMPTLFSPSNIFLVPRVVAIN